MINRYMFFLLTICTLLLLGIVQGEAQVTNLNFNNSGTNFTMTAGDTIRWEYNVATFGSTVNMEIWYDVNGNGTIDPGTDVLYASFTQTDGQLQNSGPPDLDGTADGHVIFYQRVGLVPGKYIVTFSQNGTTVSARGTVNPLASPAHTVSGHVTPPSGKSAQYILVELRPTGIHDDIFWDAFTDASGNYTIGMNSDTTGNPWMVRIDRNPYPPATITPQETTLTVSAASYTGYNFAFVAAAAQVSGYLKDDSGNPIADGGVSLMSQNGWTWIYRDARTNSSGFFQIGLLASDLATPMAWSLQSQMNGQYTTTQLSANVQISAITAGDSLFYNLVVYTANSTITGRVTINGFAPGFQLQVGAESPDTAQASVLTDAAGYFTIPVSDKISSYHIFVMNVPQNLGTPYVTAHPGDHEIALNLTADGVGDTRETGLPKTTALLQNYPNPFNPSTRVPYDLAAPARVRISVLNIIGQEVALLVDKEQQAGKYEVTFDARTLPSGIYFYRLSAGSRTSIRKMTLMR